MKKEIIGYKCPTDLYGKYSPKNTIWVQLEKANTYTVKDSDSSFILPAEIVETWEAVYKEDDFQVGDWIISDSNIRYKNCVAKIIHICEDPEYVRANCYNSESFISSGIYFYKDSLRKATEEEIKNHLIKVAKEKGYEFGNHECLYVSKGIGNPVKEGSIRSYKYNKCEDELWLNSIGAGANCVYYKGEWAKIINNKTVVNMRSDQGAFHLEVSKGGIYYPPEKTWLDPNDIKGMLESWEIGFGKTSGIFDNNYSCGIHKIDVGCKKNTYLDDWKKVWETYQKFQNE